MLIFFNS